MKPEGARYFRATGYTGETPVPLQSAGATIENYIAALTDFSKSSLDM